ncbi:MAG: hypothetical protein AMS21_01015 [Gemmatimonas sp. SG8_38_2]|nr:MAG: hypothetical protein AMS21_01015 [Gemmatimonas sp. SG8_38_2]
MAKVPIKMISSKHMNQRDLDVAQRRADIAGELKKGDTIENACKRLKGERVGSKLTFAVENPMAKPKRLYAERLEDKLAAVAHRLDHWEVIGRTHENEKVRKAVTKVCASIRDVL